MRISDWSSDVCSSDLGITAAAEHAYARMTAFVGASDTPHLLRVWNYLDAITFGDGDAERYREFCVGRARGLGDFDTHALPAATAIGRCDDARVVQVYWLAARRSEEHTSELQSLMRLP